MKKSIFASLIASAVLACAFSASAWAQFDVNSTRSPNSNTRAEGLVQGSAVMCKVINVTETTLESSVSANAFGGAIGAALGAGVANHQTSNAAAQLLGGLLGGGLGFKVAQRVASDSALSIDMRCEDIKGIVSVVQEASLRFSKGQEVMLKRIEGRVRVLPV